MFESVEEVKFGRNFAMILYVKLKFLPSPGDVSTARLQTAFANLKILDAMWRGTHNCLYDVLELAMQNKS